MRTIQFASTNSIKLEEARALLPGVEAITLDLPEVQSTDPRVVVRHKLHGMTALGLEGPVLVEDTGLMIDSWDGLPGALVKWFVDGWGPERLARLSRTAEGRGAGAEAVSAVGVLDNGHTEVWSGSIRGAHRRTER